MWVGCDVLVSSRSMASKTSVGFIGLGNMGNPMAKNLLKHGYPVIATDVFPESCKEVQELGAHVGHFRHCTTNSFPHQFWLFGWVSGHFYRLWIILLMSPKRLTASSPCSPPVPTSSRSTLAPTASSSTPLVLLTHALGSQLRHMWQPRHCNAFVLGFFFSLQKGEERLPPHWLQHHRPKRLKRSGCCRWEDGSSLNGRTCFRGYIFKLFFSPSRFVSVPFFFKPPIVSESDAYYILTDWPIAILDYCRKGIWVREN